MNIFQNLFVKSFWKVKATMRRIELKKLKKRNKELEISRDKWKEKAMERQAKIEEIEKQKREIENELKKN